LNERKKKADDKKGEKEMAAPQSANWNKSEPRNPFTKKKTLTANASAGEGSG